LFRKNRNQKKLPPMNKYQAK